MVDPSAPVDAQSGNSVLVVPEPPASVEPFPHPEPASSDVARQAVEFAARLAESASERPLPEHAAAAETRAPTVATEAREPEAPAPKPVTPRAVPPQEHPAGEERGGAVPAPVRAVFTRSPPPRLGVPNRVRGLMST